MNKGVLVLGLGNPLMSDDGAGLAALECIRRDFEFGRNVELEDGGTLGLSLLPIVEDCAALLVLDAVRFGRLAGTVACLDLNDIPMYLALKTSPHQTGFRETLALARMRGTLPAQLCVVGVEVETVEFGAPMSVKVRSALPLMIEGAITRLVEWGIPCRSITAELRRSK